MLDITFNTQSEPVISPKMIYGEQKKLCEICIITFSKVIWENALKVFPCKEIAQIGTCNGAIPIYAFDYAGKRIAFYLSPIGSAMASTCIIEANWLAGITKFIMFGSAGCLNQEATKGKLVVPTEAYRDEGMSYHYAAAADYIDIPGAQKVAEVFDGLHVPYVKGKTWTTDAIYREIRSHMLDRKSEGCLAVEMEVAGVQAVCSFHRFDLFNFLMTGDVLDMPEWSFADLGKANHCLDNFRLALEIASRV